MIAWLTAALAAPCALDAPWDAPFAVAAPPDAGGVVVMLVLRLDEDRVGWARAMLDALDARGVRAGVSARPSTPAPELAALLRDARARGHEPVVQLTATEVPRDTVRGPSRLRGDLTPLSRAAGKLRAAEVPLGDRSSEAVLHRIGIRALLEANGTSTAGARRQLRIEAQPDVGVVLPAGPYSGACGDQPIAPRFTPPAADRATQAMFGARAVTPGFVRVTLAGSDPAEAAVLGRWLDEVVSPSGARVEPPSAARAIALRALRDPARLPVDARAATGGRLVAVAEVERVAQSLDGVRRLPRQLPGDLTLTEAFQALLHVVAGRSEGHVVRLLALDGPATLATSRLAGPTPIERDALVALAGVLLDDLPERIPAALPVGGKLLAAPELLTALASAVRGDDPPMATPAEVPDPNATGLGWGSATTP